VVCPLFFCFSRVLIPDLLEANGYPNDGEVPFELFSRRFDVAHRQAA